MFCPNCGTKNDDTATPCKKCGFKLSGTSAPKFRGTMMLNSDQSVQEMVEEHRKKLAEAGQTPAPAAAGGPTPPLPSVGSTPPKAVLQPPRAALPKRRMGTMLGVAPQVDARGVAKLRIAAAHELARAREHLRAPARQRCDQVYGASDGAAHVSHPSARNGSRRRAP